MFELLFATFDLKHKNLGIYANSMFLPSERGGVADFKDIPLVKPTECLKGPCTGFEVE